MILKERRKKLKKILFVGMLVFCMVSIMIPQHIFATQNPIETKTLKKGDILHPGQEMVSLNGSSVGIYYYIGSGTFQGLYGPATPSENGFSYGGHMPNQAVTYEVITYEKVLSYAISGKEPDPIPETSTFAGWIVYQDGNEAGAGVFPIIISYNNGMKPVVEYDQNGDMYVYPEDIPTDSLIHGQGKQQITEEILNATGYKYERIPATNWSPERHEYVLCNVILETKDISYSTDDMSNAKTTAQQKAVIDTISDVNEGENIELNMESIQLTDHLADIRYVPSTWKVEGKQVTGDFKQEASARARSVTDTYTAQIPAEKAGDYNLTVTWKGQILQNDQWVDIAADKDYSKITASSAFTVKEAPAVISPEEKPNDPVIPSPKPDVPVTPEEKPNVPVQPDNSGNDSIDIVSPALPEKPDDTQHNSNSIESQDNDSSQKTPETQDTSLLWELSILCIGSLVLIAVVFSYRRKNDKAVR